MATRNKNAKISNIYLLVQLIICFQDGGGAAPSVFARFGGFNAPATTGTAPAAGAGGAFDFLAGENKNGAGSG